MYAPSSTAALARPRSCATLKRGLGIADQAGAQLRPRSAADAVRPWFSDNLEKPERFSRKRNSYHRDQRAIAWFKDTAAEHLRRIRELVSILEAHGRPVSMLTSARPGYVVYEDEHQVVAEPFAETGA